MINHIKTKQYLFKNYIKSFLKSRLRDAQGVFGVINGRATSNLG
jgi:hypothetical protein